MRELDFTKFEAALKAGESAVVQLLRKRDGIAVDRTGDSADEAQSSLEQELTAVALHRESRRLGEIRGALQRIAAGEYGVCQRCEEQIGEKRLNAVPWAAFCIRCQEKIDRERRRESECDAGVGLAA